MNPADLIGAIAAEGLAANDNWLDEWAQTVAATVLSGEIADLVRSDMRTVYGTLAYIPDNMLSLLQSPQGWTALAAYVAADLGEPSLDYQPTVH